MQRCRIGPELMPTRQSGSPSIISALELEMMPIRFSVGSNRYSLYESILRALHALLLATTEPAPTTANGSSKSLVAMCLRKIPDYIGELEEWEERQAKENGTKSALRISDISTGVYEAVTDTLPPSRGCPQLRTIARAHGLKLVKEALLGGLLEDSFALLLAKLCIKMRAHLEAEELLVLIVQRPYPKPKSSDSTFDEGRRLVPLKALREFSLRSLGPQSMLRLLSDLVSQQQLPLHWLSTKEFSSVWSATAKSLSGNEICEDAVNFAVHMITALSYQARTTAFHLRPEANTLMSLSQQTLLSTVTALTALPLLRKEAGDLSRHLPEQNSASTISSRVAYVIHACMYELKKTKKSGWIRTILRLAAYFISDTHCSTKDMDVSDLWNQIMHDHDGRDGKQRYEAAIASICSLAQCCGRGASQPSHHYLTRLCDQLDSAAGVAAEVSRKLRKHCAFILAEQTNDLRDLAFAESFNSVKIPYEAFEPTPRKKVAASSFTGFRWDEGISEWVTATPAAEKRLTRRSSAEPTNSDSVVETRQDRGDGADHALKSTFGRSSGYDASAIRSDLSDRTRRALATSRHGTRGQKRNVEVAGLLSLQSDDEEEDKQDEDETPRKMEEFDNDQPRGHSASGGVYKKRRRLSALKPRRSTLSNSTTTKTNTSPDEISDDELGL